MDPGARQAGVVAAFTALAGVVLLVWVGTREPAPPAAHPPEYDANGGLLADPSAPFVPEIGQPGKDVVWVPTSSRLVDAMLDLAEVGPTDSLVDLGSGDGRTVIAAARRGARARGIEFNPDMVALARRNASLAGVADRATFEQADFFATDLSTATVITMFLLPRLNLQLRPRLLALAPGTRVVSNSFDMGDWIRDRDAAVTDAECRSWCTALLWIVPAKVAGRWDHPDGPLVLRQTYQRVTGELGGLALRDVTLSGARLAFTAGGRRYVATVAGDTMTAADGGAWIARRTAGGVLDRPETR